LNDCDGSNPAIVSATQCVIDVLVLRSAPFNLPWGAKVYAIVVASNIQGISIPSQPGTGATIISNPDPPVNINENYS